MRCQRQWMNKFFGLFLLFSLSAQAQDAASFRTPAKLYGRAYSVKLSLKRKGFEYVVPVWVKPDQKESSLDKSLLVDMGWIYPDLKAEEVYLSGQKIEVLNFKNQKSDWATPPKFKKICCYGVIGQDILKDFEVVFDPREPIHLEWTREVSHVEITPKKEKVFFELMKSLFSITSETAKFGSEKVDFSKTPYMLDWSKRELKIKK